MAAKDQIRNAWIEYGKSIADIPSTDLSYKRRERVAWHKLQRKLANIEANAKMEAIYR